MATRQPLIIISSLWQAYDHWRGPQEYELIELINEFLPQARPHADIMWANDHMDEIHGHMMYNLSLIHI